MESKKKLTVPIGFKELYSRQIILITASRLESATIEYLVNVSDLCGFFVQLQKLFKIENNTN